MKTIVLAFAAGVSLAALTAVPASAQATRTWVSGVGDDVNPCSRTAPCKTFAGAISKTAAGGEISVLDPGGFGTLTITKSISIVADGNQGSVLNALTSGITVSTTAPAGVKVSLKGLTFEGANTGTNGVRMLQSGTLTLENCIIRNNGGSPGNGVEVANSSGIAEVSIVNSQISDNFGPGLNVKPTGTGTARVSVNSTNIVNNSVGVIADAAATSGFVQVNLINSSVGLNTGDGVRANSAGSGAVLVAQNTSFTGNNSALTANGMGAFVLVSRSLVSGNSAAFVETAGGAVRSFGDNAFVGNGASAVTPITTPLS